MKNPMQMGIDRRALLVGGLGTALAGAAMAQPRAGSSVVKMLVGFPAGQATDTVGRMMTDRLFNVTGERFIVDNRPGQGGSLALGQLAKSPADGSVLMLAHMSAVATNPHLYQRVPYDTQKDFEAVGLVGDLPFVLVCHPSMPFRDVKGLIAYAKANPGKLTNASSGNGTVSHLAMEEFKRKAGIDILHVPYKGSAAGLIDVIAGNVAIALETAAGVTPFIESGQLRALGAGTPKRLEMLKDVPTVAEQGFPEFNAVTWLMLLYPAGTPATIVQNTFNAVNKAMRTPEVEKRLLGVGALPRFSNSPQEAAAFVQSEFKHWGEVVRRSGTRLD